MISRMIVTGLVVLCLSSATSLYTAGRAPTPPAHVQQPQSANPAKSLRIFIEEDFSTAQMLKSELTDWSVRIGIPIIFVEKDVVRSRLISAREAARLMGVPDSYRLPAAYNRAYHLMGDGLAVPVVKWLERHLLRPLASAQARPIPRAS